VGGQQSMQVLPGLWSAGMPPLRRDRAEVVGVALERTALLFVTDVSPRIVSWGERPG
jgi:hypothetical protein